MPGVREGVSLNHAYKYHKDRKKAKGEKTVSKSTYRKVCYSFNKKLVERVLAGFHTQLPGHMGFIRIVGRKTDNKAIDYNATKEFGETIYHDNRHTDGNYYFWDWKKPNHLVKNMQHYSFKPTDGNNGSSLKEKLNAVLVVPNGYKRYLVLKK